ncbi:MAG: EscF/YscF/HrpA family type III secretion system needle major subunit [Deltaproteobacteria bacterium]|nr:EscF/YscF/HrpA family type III secretion system needle major subunit [Deltaproteobacteria bacterium]
MSTTNFGNIGSFLEGAVSQITERNDTFQKRVSDMTSQKGGITQEDMIQLQFEMGQYNALVESMSNITKSLTDTLKSLAQKTS